ncbi:MAG TPA: Gfo/Idh/MocA family oxidoreductase [Usitatibacter sp.]|nr:Gfo/Idh/MocA family oxidoreductase [Usitatibacter sp.]
MENAAARTSEVRYAVIGQGYVAQAAVLPAFEHARRNSRLAAIVSGDAAKRKALARRYDAPAYRYEDFARCVAEAGVDAAYIALPNDQHRDWTVRCARLGLHVLCEKPLALDERECRTMIAACRRHRVKLMTAYRLHFERATLSAIEAVRGGEVGEAKLFVSSFTNRVEPPNIRLEADQGGGTLYDIGIYCINAARHLFEAEPTQAFAMTAGRSRGGSVEESATCMLRFPGDRLATFCLSFGTDKTSEYRIVGTRGSLRVEPGYELAKGLEHHYKHGGSKSVVAYGKRDQFAAELLYFSDCILGDREPQPSGEEGLADVRVIRALYRSARSGRPVKLAARPMRTQPSPRNEKTRPPVARMPKLVHATPPSGG